jgi:type VI secretion system secreted protein VgrG
MAIPKSQGANNAASSPSSGPAAAGAMTLTFLSENPALKDAFSVVGFSGSEGISQLYHYELDLVADPARSIAFDQVLGQLVKIELPLPFGSRRIIGVLSRFTEKPRDKNHAYFQAEVVPSLWIGTKIAWCAVLQDLDVVEILKAVFGSWPAFGLNDVYQIQGQYPKRPLCVQYRETDFHFISRLMEEEGIYYYFDHDTDWGQVASLVISDTPLRHPEVPESPRVWFEETGGGKRSEDDVITDWQKTQEIRAAKYRLRDHSFELPASHLAAAKTPLPTVAVGPATHSFVSNRDFVLYDYPGGYAKRFDGVSRGGGDQSAKLQGVFQDNQRTAAIRMEQEALPGLVINGAGNCRQFRAGYRFTLVVPDPRRPSGRDEGEYLITAVQHRATQSFDRSGKLEAFQYRNRFSCIPVGLPFRPLQRTTKPTIPGTQTAVVVGNGTDGEEIFTDKYGRVKVRFFWDDRDPKRHPDSCWIRVAQAWAGKRWGASFWPRIGQEVVVAFEEGDPDRPIILGSVYNAEQMPPYLGNGLDPKHANDPRVSGIKTCTTPGGNGFNEIRFDDTKGKEQVFIRSQNALDVRALGSQRTSVGGSCHLTVCGDAREKVEKNKAIDVGSDMKAVVRGGFYVYCKEFGYIACPKSIELNAQDCLKVRGNKRLIVSSDATIVLKAGASSITLTPKGIWLNGTNVSINSGPPPEVNDLPEPESEEVRRGLDAGPFAADDSLPGFVSNANAAKKTPPEPSANGAPTGQASE